MLFTTHVQLTRVYNNHFTNTLCRGRYSKLNSVENSKRGRRLSRSCWGVGGSDQNFRRCARIDTTARNGQTSLKNMRARPREKSRKSAEKVPSELKKSVPKKNATCAAYAGFITSMSTNFLGVIFFF